MMELYNYTSFKCSKVITQTYSTSFSLGIKAFHDDLHDPIYAIYGYVRYADEIVDTFHDYDRDHLIRQFRNDTFDAIERKVSINPVLHAFQLVVNQYHIDLELIKAFLHSMEMDLETVTYTDDLFREYIYGSAEVVGLMCLTIFCNGERDIYNSLLPQARKLGSAFQKINFLRDIGSDFKERGRVYFPGINFLSFAEEEKKRIEDDIAVDFLEGLKGIKKLPKKARPGVFVAYLYYLDLFHKIKRISAQDLSARRIRISDTKKMLLMIKAMIKERITGI